MRILMTGSAGFIGKHLREELEAHDHEVIGLDRNHTGSSDPVELLKRTYVFDISEPGAFAESVRSWAPDLIVHLAAQVGREFGEDDIARTILWNATGTAMVGRAAGEYDVPVLYTSTSEVYGDMGHSVAYEHDRLMMLPHNLYGLSKRWGEEVLKLYAPKGLRIARLSMPYGPGAPPGRGRRAMDNFLWQAEHRKPIPVHDGASRSWCWVGDTVRALRLIAEGRHGGTWNVGRDDDERTLMEVAMLACDLAGAPYDLIELIPAPQRQTVVKRLSTGQIKHDFGWEPEVELEDGMAKVYEWIKNFDAEGQWIGAAKAA